VKLNVFKEVKTRVPRSRLHRVVAIVSRREKISGWRGAINLTFVGDARTRRLSQKFRGQDRTIDVLSFNHDDGKALDSILGEVYISVPQARRQARKYGVSLSAEYLRLATHGLLHLLGYDHGQPSQEKKMIALQEEYLERLKGGRR